MSVGSVPPVGFGRFKSGFPLGKMEGSIGARGEGGREEKEGGGLSCQRLEISADAGILHCPALVLHRFYVIHENGEVLVIYSGKQEGNNPQS